MYKYLVLGAVFLFAFPAAAASSCIEPVAPQYPYQCDSPSSFSGNAAISCNAAYTKYQADVVAYKMQMDAYKTCTDQSIQRQNDAFCQQDFDAMGGHGTAYFDPKKGVEIGRNGLFCSMKCDAGYYATQSGTCKLHSSLANPVEEKPAPVVESPEPVVTAPSPAPVVEISKKTILDAVPIFKIKKGEPVSPAKVEATTTVSATTSVETPAPKPSLLHRVLRILNPLNWF